MPAEIGILSQSTSAIVETLTFGFANLWPEIRWLITILLGIEITLFGFWMALGGPSSILSIIKKIMFLAFWLYFVSNFPTLANALVTSLVNAGFMAGGNSALDHSLLLDPSRIISYGVIAGEPIKIAIDQLGKFDIGQGFILGFAYIGIVLTYIILGIMVAIAVIEFFYIVALAGILLPFGFLKITWFIAEPSLSSVLQSGIKLMTMAFLISVTQPILSTLSIDPDIPMNQIWSMMSTSLLILALAWNIPRVAAGLTSGRPHFELNAVAAQTTNAARILSNSTKRLIQNTKQMTSKTVGAATYGAGRAHAAYSAGAQLDPHSRLSRVQSGLSNVASHTAQSAANAITQPTRAQFNSGTQAYHQFTAEQLAKAQEDMKKQPFYQKEMQDAKENEGTS